MPTKSPDNKKIENTGVTGQFADKPTCSQSSRRPVNSGTSQLAKMFIVQWKIWNICHFQYIILFVRW